MNEITRIHLGRQPFTISIEAHKQLKVYLAEIEKVADKSVVDEVELRMAELLGERGVGGEKVVLSADIDFLQQQLGNPADFSEDDEAHAPSAVIEQAPKRLFRDTENGMLAGVAAGLANYFGLDVVLIRIVFVLLSLFSGGVGILIYVVLWLVVPPATTSSEKLQMRGKLVTVDTLKKSVAAADIPGAARRANLTVLPVINSLFKLALRIIALATIALGVLIIFSLLVVKTYMVLHHGQFFQEGLFPVGAREQWLVNLVFVLVGIASVFVVLVGATIFKRKWPIKAWATAVLAGVFLVLSAGAAALSADIGPRVQARYESGLHTTAITNIQPFNSVSNSGDLDVEYISSPTYSVNLHYYGHPDISKIKITVANGTLRIDSTAFSSNHCTMVCLFPRYNMTVQVYAPNVQKFDMPAGDELMYPADRQPT